MAALSVLLCTEGTYPFVGGGVSTWCDILCRELDEVDFTVYAITGNPEVTYRYSPPDNVRGVVHLPLWGAEDPNEYTHPGVSLRTLTARRRETTDDVIERRFVPLLRELVRGFEPEHSHPLAQGRVVHGLWRYFQHYDWRRTWRSRPAWDAFVEEALRQHRERPGDVLPAEEPSAYDLTTAMRWLSNYLLELAAPLPRADLVHTTIAAFAGLAGVVAKHEHGTAFLATDHGVWVRERYIALSGSDELTPFGRCFLLGFSSLVSRLVYAHADVVSPVTNFNRRWEIPWGVEPHRIETISNAVDPSVFVPRPKPPSTAGRPTVVAAARIFPLKDIETMIRSAVIARERIPNVQYLVYGSLETDPPYTERLRSLIAELSLEGTFTLAGHHANPPEIFGEGDISALSSISEAFPYTVLESMSCQRPVVGTDVGGVREALEGFGIVVPPRDPQAFGEAVVQLLTDDELRLELGRRGREQVLAHYRVDQAMASYRDLYGRLAALPRLRPI